MGLGGQEPLALVHNEVVLVCRTVFGWKQIKTLRDFRFLGQKKLVHPRRTTFGDFGFRARSWHFGLLFSLFPFGGGCCSLKGD